MALYRRAAGFLVATFWIVIAVSFCNSKADAAPEPATTLDCPHHWSTDIDGNGFTGLGDLSKFTIPYLSGVDPIPCTVSWDDWRKCDFDCDQKVGLRDFSIWFRAWILETNTSGECP